MDIEQEQKIEVTSQHMGYTLGWYFSMRLPNSSSQLPRPVKCGNLSFSELLPSGLSVILVGRNLLVCPLPLFSIFGNGEIS